MNAKLLSIAAAAGLLIGTTALAQAQSRGGMGGGASGASPGHEMQEKGSKGGPGASGFSPGHEMQREGSRNGAGASGFAPGHDDETTGVGDRDDRLRGDRDDRMMDNDRRGIDKD